jgi:hypothetical protein
MTLNDISNSRLNSQKIAKPEFKTAKEIVSWMGAIQAQDYPMAKWAVGVRLRDPEINNIESAIDKGEIIRIHVLRPTWHLVAADDVYWMLQLSSAKIKSASMSRHKELGLTEPVLAKTRRIIEKALAAGISLTRNELAKEFQKSGINTDANRLSHILFSAEMEGIVCSGPLKNDKLTYVLISERVPQKKEYSKDESLAELARRYFISRCPATIEDFSWWSNLSLGNARRAIDIIRSDFSAETIGTSEYWLPNSFTGAGKESAAVHLLPAFDEFLISYRDRSSSLALVHNKKTVTDNGIFHPPIVINGQVAGLWRRTFKKNSMVVETEFFQPVSNTVLHMTEKKAGDFGQFLSKKTEVRNNHQKLSSAPINKESETGDSKSNANSL